MKEGFDQYSLVDVRLAQTGMDQQIPVPASKAKSSFVYQDRSCIFPQGERQLPYYGQVLFGLFEGPF